MSQESLPRRPDAGAPPIRFVLRPHRALGRTGFIVLMSIVALVSFVAGLAFAMIGAWPVLGFFGLDVGLIWLAFRLNYRSGRALETIDIADGRLTLAHVDGRGRRSETALAAAWVDVRLHRSADGRTKIALASHGREHAFGGFLTDEERQELAPALREALLSARGGPRI